VYLVTTRRAILYPPLRSYDRRQLHNKMELRESSYQEDAGSLIFEIEEHIEAKSGTQRANERGFERRVTEHGFKDIADVVEVEKLIRTTIIRNKPGQADEDLEGGADAQEPPAVVDDNIKPAGAAPGAYASRLAAPAEDAQAAPAQGKKKKQVSQEAVEASRGLIEESPVSQRIKDRALKRLDDDERVLWVGQPHQKLILLRSLMPAGFSLVVAVVLIVLALKQPSWMMWLMATVFLGAAIVLPIVQRVRARLTLYVLTHRRATVWEPNAIGKMKACDYTVEKLSRMFRRNALFVKGAGDLVFRTLTQITTTSYYKQRRGGGRTFTGSQTSVQTFYWGFLAIDEVAHVEGLINEHLVGPYLDRIHQD
jgi:hypothetical protein